MILEQVFTAAGAFSATNVDDLVLLVLFLSRPERGPGPAQVLLGQLLGIGLLVAVSLLGFFGRLLVSPDWLGLLGLLPISLGLTRLIAWLEDPAAADPDLQPVGLHPLAGVAGVAAVTVANGGDNIGVYLPLFAQASPLGLLITVVVFALGIGLWCWLAWRLARLPGVAALLARGGALLMPLVLIGLGGLILLDSQALAHRSQAVIALSGLVLLLLAGARQLQPGGSPAPAVRTAAVPPRPDHP